MNNSRHSCHLILNDFISTEGNTDSATFYQFFRSDDELQHSSSSSMHEHHRKRHEEVDNCPEEIKLMKVEALTLECTASSSSPDQSPMLHNVDSGPKFCLKSLTSNGTPEKDHSIHRHSIEQ